MAPIQSTPSAMASLRVFIEPTSITWMRDSAMEEERSASCIGVKCPCEMYSQSSTGLMLVLRSWAGFLAGAGAPSAPTLALEFMLSMYSSSMFDGISMRGARVHSRASLTTLKAAMTLVALRPMMVSSPVAPALRALAPPGVQARG